MCGWNYLLPLRFGAYLDRCVSFRDMLLCCTKECPCGVVIASLKFKFGENIQVAFHITRQLFNIAQLYPWLQLLGSFSSSQPLMILGVNGLVRPAPHTPLHNEIKMR